MRTLRDHMARYIPITDADWEIISGFFQKISVGKKQVLLQEGQFCHEQYFVVEGCLRLYFINDKGDEQTTDFAIENWWLSDYNSLISEKPANFSIQAVTASKLISLSAQTQQELFTALPSVREYFMRVHQRAQAAGQQRIRHMYGQSREELYFEFAAKYPGFLQRVPQYLLASFLGFTPEYLSEIRSRKRS